MSGEINYTANQLAALAAYTKDRWLDSGSKMPYHEYHDRFKENLHLSDFGIDKIEQLYFERQKQRFAGKPIETLPEKLNEGEIAAAKWKADKLYRKDYPQSDAFGKFYNKHIDNFVKEISKRENPQFLEIIKAEYKEHLLGHLNTNMAWERGN